MTEPDPSVVPLLKKAKPLLNRWQDLLHVEKEVVPVEGGTPFLILTFYMHPVNQPEWPQFLKVVCDPDGALEYGLLTDEEYDMIPFPNKENPE